MDSDLLDGKYLTFRQRANALDSEETAKLKKDEEELALLLEAEYDREVCFAKNGANHTTCDAEHCDWAGRRLRHHREVVVSHYLEF